LGEALYNRWGHGAERIPDVDLMVKISLNIYPLPSYLARIPKPAGTP
jgi:hypothetical protein